MAFVGRAFFHYLAYTCNRIFKNLQLSNSTLDFHRNIPWMNLYEIPSTNFDPLINMDFFRKPTLIILSSGGKKALIGFQLKGD